MKPQMKVQAARYALMKQRPYLAMACVRLRLVASEACPHALAASEGWTLYYNPTVVEQTEIETLVIMLRREVERLIRRHPRRLKALPREVAELASTMEVDDDLAGEYGSRPDWTLPQQMGLEAGRTAEEYALALLDLIQSQDSSQSQSHESQEGDSDAGSSGAGAEPSSDEKSDGRDGASADDAPTPSAKQSDSSANAADSSQQGAGTPAEGAGKDQSSHGACGRSRGDSSSSQPPSANAGDSSSSQSQSGGASGAQNGACDATQRPSDQTGDDDARDSDPAPESSCSSSQPPQQGSAASGRPAPW